MEAEAEPIGKHVPKKRVARVVSPESEVSRDFLARLLGVDVRTVTNLADEGMPKVGRGRFALDVAVKWYIERERAAARGSKGLNDLDLARQRKTVAEARIAEMTLAEKESGVVPRDVYMQRLRERLETVAGNLKAMGRYQPDVKAAITDEAADALLDRMADEIMAELFDLKDTIE